MTVGKRLTPARIWQLSFGLSPRDLAIVEMLSVVRIACARQIERVVLPAQARTTRRVLKELTERRVLARLGRTVGGVRAGSAGHIYSLDVVGQYLSQQGGPAGGSRLRAPWTPGARFVDHALAVTEVYVRLVEKARREHLRLYFEGEPESWRVFHHLGASVSLKPDAFARLQLNGFEDSYFIEVDRGSESVRTLAGKAELYREYWLAGIEQDAHGVFPRVLWIAPDEARAKVVQRALDEAGADATRLHAVTTLDGFEQALGSP